jgi:hypothetical protein
MKNKPILMILVAAFGLGVTFFVVLYIATLVSGGRPSKPLSPLPGMDKVALVKIEGLLVNPDHIVEEINDQLTEYGLSKNEARVITFLTKRGAERASVAAHAIRLNRTETYRTLRNLQRRGLVEASLEQPVRFQVAPFSRCLEILLTERKNRLAVLQERTAVLERA